MLEKETKIKAFSSTGLTRDSTDPMMGAAWLSIVGETVVWLGMLHAWRPAGREQCTRTRASCAQVVTPLARCPRASSGQVQVRRLAQRYGVCAGDPGVAGRGGCSALLHGCWWSQPSPRCDLAHAALRFHATAGGAPPAPPSHPSPTSFLPIATHLCCVAAPLHQVEQFEADLEALGPAKARGSRPPRANELERCMARHKEHIARLEQVLRLLENDQVRCKAGRHDARAALLVSRCCCWASRAPTPAATGGAASVRTQPSSRAARARQQCQCSDSLRPAAHRSLPRRWRAL